MSKEADELIRRGYKVFKDGEGKLVAYGRNADDVSGYRPVSEVYQNLDTYQLPAVPKKRTRSASARGVTSRADQRKAQEGYLDKAYQANREMVASQPGWQNALIHAGRESDKFVQGAKDIKDIGAILAQAPVDLIAGTDWTHDNFQNIVDRDMQELIKDESYRAMEDETGFSKVAGIAPFYAISPALQAPSKAVAKGVEKALDKVTGEVVDQTAGRVGRTFDKWRATGSPSAERIYKESVGPSRRRRAGKKKQAKFVNPTGVTGLQQILRAGAEGSMEGALYHGKAPMEGSLEAIAGDLLASPIRRFTDRSPDLWADPQQRELLEWAKTEHGYKPAPGMETGSGAQQRFDDSLGGSHGMTDVMARRKAENDKVFNRAAWQAAGLPGLKEGESMKDAITNHMDNLRQGYQDIEARSVGYITPEIRTDIQGIVDQFDGSDIFSQEARAAIQPFVDDMIGKGLPIRNPLTGRFNSQTFDGSKYQKVRQRIQAAKTDAYNNDNTTVGGALSQLLNKFDETLKAGIERSGKTPEEGKALVNAWMDQNEKFAVTSALINKGSDVFGNFDAQKFENHLMGSDAFRTITGTGPESIQTLQKLVKLRNMEKGQQKAGLTTPGVRDIDTTGKTTLGMKALETVRGNSLLPGQELLTKLYLEGILGFQPSVKGLLNTRTTPEGNLWDISRIARAGAQAANPTEIPGQYVREAVGMDSEEEKRERMLDYMSRLNKN